MCPILKQENLLFSLSLFFGQVYKLKGVCLLPASFAFHVSLESSTVSAM